MLNIVGKTLLCFMYMTYPVLSVLVDWLLSYLHRDSLSPRIFNHFLNLSFTTPDVFMLYHLFQNGNVELTRFTSKLPMDQITSRLNEGNAKHDMKAQRLKESKLPMDEITNRLTTEKPDELKGIKMREEMMPVVKVSKMAELLVSKFKNNCDQPPPEPLGRRVVGIVHWFCWQGTYVQYYSVFDDSRHLKYKQIWLSFKRQF